MGRESQLVRKAGTFVSRRKTSSGDPDLYPWGAAGP